ncbi:Hypothetical protein RG540_PA03770 (plasmid) [Neorhizobium galegae bv. orientalis str. HAMBI 540]|uniref:Uncharacterized protein n=1 Tax=Neorhizobium galegae bv. orientalis str. HAMBI 540 TaxID=1028800 RepID=A0A068T0R0_NEOGA|nr:Hypothetical protein RG540_PA03770 [Neorhizobium galegae bv. orientalis str. HAMBI 540]
MEERLIAYQIGNRIVTSSLPLEPLVDEADHRGKCPEQNLRLSTVTKTLARRGRL